MYIKKESNYKKYEECARWVMEMLTEYDGVISFQELRFLGLEERFSRQDLYNTLPVIGKKIVRGGSKKMAIWYTVEKYKELGEPKGIDDFLDERGYGTVGEYIKDNGFILKKD
ncbi:MAG: hypothetical protein ABII09_12510 [Planctomycetota bacterium]